MRIEIVMPNSFKTKELNIRVEIRHVDTQIGKFYIVFLVLVPNMVSSPSSDRVYLLFKVTVINIAVGVLRPTLNTGLVFVQLVDYFVFIVVGNILKLFRVSESCIILSFVQTLHLLFSV